MAQDVQQSWEPNVYRVHCDRASGCLSAGIRHRIDQLLRRAVIELKAIGFRAPKRFGPRKNKGVQGQDHIVVFDKESTTIAWVQEPCNGGINTMNIGTAAREWSSKLHIFYYFLAHEMFHAIQPSYPAFGPNPCKAPGWIKESTADAIGWHLARKRYPQHFPGRDARTARKDAGLRPYHVPLNGRYRGLRGDDWVTSGVSKFYVTSSFWRHIAEVYFDGSFKYLHSFFRVRPSGGDWLAWLNNRLLVEPGIKRHLSLVFAGFMADYAGWGDRGMAGEFFGRGDWLKRAYGDCTKVSLSPTQATWDGTIALRRTSAKCLQVTVTGIVAGQRATVQAAVLKQPTRLKAIDQVQLAFAASTDSKKFHCARAMRSNNRQKRLEGMAWCVFVGGSGEAKLGGVDYAARTWQVVPQRVHRGTSFENLYLLSRVADRPSDRAKRGDGGDVLNLRLVLALDVSKLKVTGAPGPSSGKRTSTVGHLNHRAAANSQESVPLSRADGSPAVSLTNPAAMRPPMPPVGAMAIAPGQLDGIYRINFTQAAVREDMLYQESLDELETFAVQPMQGGRKKLKPRPLRVGDRGTFKAHISGGSGGQGWVSRSPGKLVVEEFTPFVLRARVSGQVCALQFTPRRCESPRFVSGTIVKAFAGFDLPGSKFVVKETPSTKHQRAEKSKWMNRHRGVSGAGGGSGGTGAGGGGGAGSTVDEGGCKCSCKDMATMQELAKKMRGGMPSPKVMNELQRLSRCAASCSQTYATCKKR